MHVCMYYVCVCVCMYVCAHMYMLSNYKFKLFYFVHLSVVNF